MCSLPTCTCTVSHLKKNRGKRSSLFDCCFDFVVCGVCVCFNILTGVCPAVCLKVGAFGVHFVAPGKVTTVNSPLFQCVGGFSGDGMLRARVNYY